MNWQWPRGYDISPSSPLGKRKEAECTTGSGDDEEAGRPEADCPVLLKRRQKKCVRCPFLENCPYCPYKGKKP